MCLFTSDLQRPANELLLDDAGQAASTLEVYIEARWEAMMKAMHCGELMKGCDFVARGATEDEVMKKAAEHAKAAHGIDNITPELAQKVKAAIKNE